MKVAVLLAGAALSQGVLRSPASAADTLVVPTAVATSALPVQLGPNARALYRAVFDDIDAGRWTEAASKLDVMPDGPLHAVARAAIYLGKGSPKVDGAQLAALATNAPQLPEASTLVRLAAARGIDALPALPEPRTLGWLGTSPHRGRTATTEGDAVASVMGQQILQFIKDDRPAEAEALLALNQPNLTPEGLTRFSIPHLVAPVSVFPKKGEREDYAAALDTVMIEPDQHRFTLTWRVARPLKKSMFEVAQVLVGKKGKEWWQQREQAVFPIPVVMVPMPPREAESA